MNLIIFDIDGTLTQTNEMDSRCFAQAIKDVLRINSLNTDWSSYRYSTDSGLMKEIYENLFQREPQNHEIDEIRNCFVRYLKQEWQKNTSLISPITGAEKIFQKILNLSNWHIGIATGGWKKSALFKLDSAMIPHALLPKAYADDHIERAEIIKIVIKQSQLLHDVPQYVRIIYVGDKSWDHKAAAQLNIEFIGVGDEFSHLPRAQHFSVKNYEVDSSFLQYLS